MATADDLAWEEDDLFLDEVFRYQDQVESLNPSHAPPPPVTQETPPVAAASAAPLYHIPASATASLPLSHVAAWPHASAASATQALPLAAAPRASSADPVPRLFHVPAGPAAPLTHFAVPSPRASSSAAYPFAPSHIADAPCAPASVAVAFSPPREFTQSGRAGGPGFSPPRELSQRPVDESSDCQVVMPFVAPAGGGRGRGGVRRERDGSDGREWRLADEESRIIGTVDPTSGGDRARAVRRERDAREAKERKEVEKLKKELMDVSKRMNNYKNECSELKKGMTQKDLEMKAKDAEIDSLKKAHVGRASKDICSTGMDIDQSFHTPANDTLNDRVSCWTSTTNGNNKELHSSRDGLGLNEAYQTAAPDVLEPKQQTVINNRTSTSGRVSLEETPQPELKSNNEHLERKKVLINSISSNLCAIWGRPANSMLGRSLISKILVSCSEEMLTLFQSTRLLDKCETSSKASSSMNNAISEVYDIIIKVNNDAMPIRILLEALLNLCVFGNAVVAGRALRMLHNILQNLLSHGTNSNQRNNVSIETYVNNNEMERNSHGGSSTLLNKPDTENLLRSEDGLHTSNMSLPPTFRTSFFNAVLQVALKYSEESIRVHALSIMILIVRTSDPKGDREKIGFTSVMESLHQLLQKENELLVKKHSVHLLFLLLNCPVMLKLLCNGGKGSSELMEAVGFENDRPQQATSSVLKDLSECLTCDATNSLELELCRLVVNLLAYIASSGKSGHTVLLGSVTASGANFLELIMEVLASQMESGVDFSTAVHELLEERYLLMREALILLNRLVSHPIFSKTTLQVLMGSKLCASLTMDIANRLPQRSKYPLRHLSEICPQKANDLAELAQKFCSRVYGYLEEQQHSIADRSK